MSLKRFRTYAKNTLLIALSMIVMAGATGLSYKAHYCHGICRELHFILNLVFRNLHPVAVRKISQIKIL